MAEQDDNRTGCLGYIFKAPLRFLKELFFHDIPYVIDRLFRFLEFKVNSSQSRQGSRKESVAPVRIARTTAPGATILAVVAVFGIYGPTLDAMCSTGLPASVLAGMALLAFVAAILLPGLHIYKVLGDVIHRYAALFLKTNIERCRKTILSVILLMFVVLLFGVPLYLTRYYLAGLDVAGVCGSGEFRLVAWLQLVFAVLVVVAVLWGRWPRKWLDVTRPNYHRVPFFFFALLLLAMVLLSGHPFGEPVIREAYNLPYVNVYLIAVLILSLPLLAVRELADEMFPEFRRRDYVPRHLKRSPEESGDSFVRQLGGRLATVELFSGAPTLPELSAPRILYALLINPMRYPLHLLLPPALLILIAPYDLVQLFWSVGLLLSYAVVYTGGITMRWDRILFVMTRFFFEGLPLLLSVVVIGLGVARLLDIHYVASILDVAPFGAVTFIIIMLYAAFWLYNIWLNHSLQHHLFLLLKEAADTQPRSDDGSEDTGYSINNYYCTIGATTTDKHIDVLARHRDLQKHGASAFAVVGDIRSGEGMLTSVYQVWSPVDLFKKLAGDDDSSEATQPNPVLIEGFRSLRRRIRLYRGLMNLFAVGMLVLAFMATGWVGGAYDDANLRVEDTPPPPAISYDLVEALAARGNPQSGGQPGPAIIVAASGGGTRAALYTQAVLRGLKRIGALDDVVLVSGVSGGGVALAYLAAHYPALAREDAKGEEWARFGSHMADPFIQDVLEGVLEPRLYWRTRTGVLLAESFQRRLGSGADNDKVAESPIGFVLNTTIVGHPWQDTELTRNLFDDAGDNAIDELPREEVPPYTVHQGGRLILTNLADVGMFPSSKSPLADDIHFPVTPLQDNKQIQLMQAGALNANFPPVFFNAPIDVHSKNGARRYYVTDGGATDNRGVVTALYILRDAVEKLTQAGRKVPPIYLVVAEASADTYDYGGDTGLDAAFGGAKKMLANGLIQELQSQIKGKINTEDADTATLETFYMNMPMVLRTRGGLGTHWLMPGHVRVSNPYTVEKTGPQHKLSKKQYLCLLDELFLSGSIDPMDQRSGECNAAIKEVEQEFPDVIRWICRDPVPGKVPNPRTCINPGGQALNWRALQAKYPTQVADATGTVSSHQKQHR